MSLYNDYLNGDYTDKGKQIVFYILDDILERSGLEQAFEECDIETKEEILTEWIKRTRVVLGEK